MIVFALLILGVENIFAGGTIISNAKRIASGKIELELKTGKLTLIPLNQNSIRVQFSQPDSEPVEELIYTESVKAPKPQIKEMINRYHSPLTEFRLCLISKLRH